MQTLKDTYKLKLTDSQLNAVESITEFLESPRQAFILKGYAGTGKTFLLKGIAEYLDNIGVETIFMAPTGKAARVITESTGWKASTIHRSIYQVGFVKESSSSIDSLDSLKYYFEIRRNITRQALYIIDEASMIPDLSLGNELMSFGSGSLLNDLLQFIGYSNKIIFVGDPAQLPPVKNILSPALTPDYLKENFFLEANSVELTDVVRQKDDSNLLEIATDIRTAISNKTFDKMEIKENNNDIIHVPKAKLLEEYLEVSDDEISDDVMIIAYSNKMVRHYNRIIRDHFFPNRTNIGEDDRVIVLNNVYMGDVDLMNGEIGKVQRVSPYTESKSIPVYSYNGAKRVHLTFRDVVIEFKDENGREKIVECKIYEPLLESLERDMSYEEKLALYYDFKSRFPQLKPGSKKFIDHIKVDPYFNCLRLKYAYAITCHKAQGGEWENVFVDFTSINGYKNETYFRWVYTAITRASERLYAYNPPTILPGTQLDYEQKIDTKTTIKDTYQEFNKDNDLHPDLIDSEDNVRNIYHALLHCLDKDISIEKIRHLPACERYTFRKASKDLVFDIWYNKSGSITLINPLPGNNIDIEKEISQNIKKLSFKKLA